MNLFPEERQYGLIGTPDSHFIGPSSSQSKHASKNKPLKLDDGTDFVRDITFLLEDVDSVICSLKDEVCNLIFLLGGPERVMGSDAKFRSVDERWYPTTSTENITILVQQLSRFPDKVVRLAEQMSKDPANYVNF